MALTNNSRTSEPKTLMLVDDKEVANFIMKKNISIYLPYAKAVEFTNPDEAFEAITATNPDIIFLDLCLPMVEDGWYFLDRMMEKQMDHKVVILTSSISDDDYEKANRYPNVVNFISKPIFGEELQAIYNELCEETSHLVKTSA